MVISWLSSLFPLPSSLRILLRSEIACAGTSSRGSLTVASLQRWSKLAGNDISRAHLHQHAPHVEHARIDLHALSV